MDTQIKDGKIVPMSPEDIAQRVIDQSAPVVQLSPLTRRQIRMGLVLNDVNLADVDTVLAAIEDPQERAIATIEWQDALQFERDHPLLKKVAPALGLTEDQVDAMWHNALLL